MEIRLLLLSKSERKVSPSVGLNFFGVLAFSCLLLVSCMHARVFCVISLDRLHVSDLRILAMCFWLTPTILNDIQLCWGSVIWWTLWFTIAVVPPKRSSSNFFKGTNIDFCSSKRTQQKRILYFSIKPRWFHNRSTIFRKHELWFSPESSAIFQTLIFWKSRDIF